MKNEGYLPCTSQTAGNSHSIKQNIEKNLSGADKAKFVGKLI